MIAMLLLWFSMAFGLTITNKLSRLWPGGPAATALHEFSSLLGIVFAIFHAFILLGDHYIKFEAVQILIPFATQSYKPIWVGVGQISLYLWIIITASFYIRRRIGHRLWRTIHYASFVTFLIALLHSLASGSDSGADWVQWSYWLMSGSLLYLFIYRILYSLINRLKTRKASAI